MILVEPAYELIISLNCFSFPLLPHEIIFKLVRGIRLMFRQNYTSNLNRICAAASFIGYKEGRVGGAEVAAGDSDGVGIATKYSARRNNEDDTDDYRLKTDNKLDRISTVMNIKVWPLNDNEQINNEKDMVYRLQTIADKINAYFGKKVRIFSPPFLGHLRSQMAPN